VNIHVRSPNEAAILETTIALTALAFIANSLPPLKPNQPNHKRLVPKKMSETFDGLRAWSTVFLGPTASAYLNID
jgi:hypothetical protein